MNQQPEIIELRQQIEKLEQRIAHLEAKIDHLCAGEASPMPRRKNSKVNERMLEACYTAAEEYSANARANIRGLAEAVNQKTGMNRNNAFMTILTAYALLSGEVYKRAISGKATAYFFERILAEQGAGGLARAVGATRRHIAYRRALNHNVDRLEALCAQYEERL